MANVFSKLTETDPLTYGVSIDTAKRYLRIDHSLDDDIINELITGSLNATELFLGYPITSRSLSGKYPSGWAIDVAPYYVKEVKDVYTIDGDVTASISASDYEVVDNPDGTKIQFNVLPTTPYVGVEFNTGELTIPSDVKLAMLKFVVDGYEQRANDIYGVSVAKSSFSFDRLLVGYKRYTL